MFKTLYGKIAVILLVLFLALGLLNVFQTLLSTKLYIQEVNQRLNRNLSEYLVSERDFFLDGKVNKEALKDSFENLMHINPNIELYLLDPLGKIQAYSAPEGKVARDSVDVGPLKKYLDGEATFPTLGDDPREPGRKKIFTVSKIPSEGPLEGYLYIILGGEIYDTVASRLEGSYILRLSTWIAVAGLFFVFVTGLYFFNLLTRRIRKLTAAVDSFKQSDFRKPIEISGRLSRPFEDEIDRLSGVVRQMSDRIIEQMNIIRRMDSFRREMVSSISHDLRTPLTSLQAHLEHLLFKEDDLQKKELHDYLKISLKQSQKLERLIADLFELAKLDSPEIELNFEVFNICELAQDIIQEYRLIADSSQVELRFDCPKDLPLVEGDIALIERAIQNLLSNALEFSQPRGTIGLSISKEDSRMSIRIMDNGPGIKQEDIPFIFNPFFQGSKSKQKKDDSSGLGLTIAKRIVELHGSSIEVHSEPYKRTAFTFYLPLYSI